tara:strand:+ start:1350 stop:1970 length:621 start_codon:yes stop_codon:yes gene_type:complete
MDSNSPESICNAIVVDICKIKSYFESNSLSDHDIKKFFDLIISKNLIYSELMKKFDVMQHLETSDLHILEKHFNRLDTHLNTICDLSEKIKSISKGETTDQRKNFIASLISFNLIELILNYIVPNNRYADEINTNKKKILECIRNILNEFLALTLSVKKMVINRNKKQENYEKFTQFIMGQYFEPKENVKLEYLFNKKRIIKLLEE